VAVSKDHESSRRVYDEDDHQESRTGVKGS
jgi:hypothetical protein